MKKSESLSSLNLPASSENLILTSTLNPTFKHSSFSNLTRRMDIIPTPNRPVKLSASNKTQLDDIEDSSKKNSLKVAEKNRVTEDDNVLTDNCQHSSEIPHSFNIQSHQKDHISDEDEDNNLFDKFICENFAPFSGAEPVAQWLDKTDELFHRFKISRKLRFQAIPLLVQGDAKRQYINNRHVIKCFDDFYEVLLTHFDSIAFDTSKSTLVNNKVEFAKDSVYISNMTTDSKSTVTNTTDVTQLLNSSNSYPSQLTTNHTTIMSGNVSDSKTTGNTSTCSRLSSDPVITDLRKAIVSDFIRNPKIFRGNKDDITKWLEDIDHLLQIAHVPDANRLDLISYSLRGDASQWFRNNKSTLTSWDKFVQEIKKAFASSFSEELAFKTLESYSQGEKQSVQNFFNEVIKLCKKADYDMTDSTKLKNLLNKVKPSIQLEVRKKKPKTTVEFLEYAKEIEELLQLSSIGTDSVLSSASKSNNSTKNTTSSNTSFVQYSKNFNSNYRTAPQSSFRANQGSSRYASDTDYVFKPDRTQTSNSNYYNKSPRSSFFTSQYNKDNITNHNQKNLQQKKNFSKPDNKTTARTVNAVFTSSLPPNNEDNLSSISTVICQLCNYMGHDASSCPNFQ
ncbi:unnamed protein product [Rotaria magnacalcarata]|uniref:Ty3 transposon capsid-like protein domain-containing protein n=2 Tax=Rotaria magnacalcarata TaxID=392030 RepID=A0A816MY97_9BILA|nr:unnamed protein product [Rotaria magnacalcarata]